MKTLYESMIENYEFVENSFKLAFDKWSSTLSDSERKEALFCSSEEFISGEEIEG